MWAVGTLMATTPAPARGAERILSDSLITLCVLMGRPTASEAVREALQYTGARACGAAHHGVFPPPHTLGEQQIMRCF
ncbi:hypothetical protein ADK59_35780 [Streptomyces sp. XY332]|nr:hypothetical protein ADK59_35780 [Streptomyces sp. XY332]